MEEQESADEPDASASPLIFISYRTDFDHSIAVAVKRLIEASLEPSPGVFVSGDGGLRPSAQGFKPQLQQAVASARAFVGIITQASKEREWLFFEAGAAFGRGQIYSPLLVDVGPDELGDSIADYQAVKASNKDAVYRLMQALADAVGASLKPQFGKRFMAFQRALQASTEKGDGDDEGSGSSDPLLQGLRHLLQGNAKAADELLRPIEQDPSATGLAKAEIKVMRIVSRPNQTAVESLQALEGCDAETRASPAWQFWAGTYEPMPHVSLEYLRKAAQAPEPHNWRPAALRELHRKLVGLGRDQEALEVASWGLRQGSRRLRSEAAMMLGAMRVDLGAFLRLLLLLYGDLLWSPQIAALGLAVLLAIDEKWPRLAMFLARRLSTTKDDTHLELGRVYHAFGFPSLAYREFRFAASKGVGAGRLNAAILLKDSVVASAALEQLELHQGAFEVSDPAMPHRVRADLEDAVRKEVERANALALLGELSLSKLLAVVDRCLRSERAPAALPQKMASPDAEVTVVPTGPNQYLLKGRGVASDSTLSCPLPVAPLWIATEGKPGKQIFGVYEQLPSGELSGIIDAPGENESVGMPHSWQPR